MIDPNFQNDVGHKMSIFKYYDLGIRLLDWLYITSSLNLTNETKHMKYLIIVFNKYMCVRH